MTEGGSETRPLTDAEEAFADFKSLVRIHLKQMLTLELGGSDSGEVSISYLAI